MLKKAHIVAVGVGLSMVLAQPVFAAETMVKEGITVKGYAKDSSSGVVKDSSGDCVRTPYQDTSELLGDCGYKIIVEEAAKVETTPKKTSVTVVEAAAVTKDDKVIAAAAVVEEVTIENIEFEFNSSVLKESSKANIRVASDQLAPHRELLRSGVATLKVVGHTDSQGAAAYNQTLSERRAQSVADYMFELDPTRKSFTTVEGRGETQPIADNGTAEGRASNRRVVFEVIRK